MAQSIFSVSTESVMPREDKSNQFLAIRSMFLSGNVKRMKDIEKLYPTLVAKSLRMNHSRYIQKLYKPEEFTFKQVISFSNLLDIEASVIIEVILKQISSGKTARRR